MFKYLDIVFRRHSIDRDIRSALCNRKAIISPFEELTYILRAYFVLQVQ